MALQVSLKDLLDEAEKYREGRVVYIIPAKQLEQLLPEVERRGIPYQILQERKNPATSRDAQEKHYVIDLRELEIVS
ncbi:MAG: hypothetical protein Q8R53_02930 [Nanoarchaeota archaeon]|nr:hypothetical protein [Nanoarchaeota archaeon]